MYLHIGGNEILPEKRIIGVFDLDQCTCGKRGQEYLRLAEEEGAVKSHRVLEVNAKHPVFEVMQKAQEAGDDEKVKLYSGILYDQALLVEGIPLDDPVAYTEAVTKLMK